VGEPFGRGHPAELGLIGQTLTHRHVAFLLSVLQETRVGAQVTWGELTTRRARIRERLGMTPDGFENWIGRNVTSVPGAVLRWNESRTLGHGPSRTEGTWWIAAKEIQVLPSFAAAYAYLDEVARVAASRRNDPAALLRAAEEARAADRWGEALEFAQEAALVYANRRWSRGEPLWFSILLLMGGIEMQLGSPHLRPVIAANVERSLKNPRQRVKGLQAAIARARAHHLAALICNQQETRAGASAALDHLAIAQSALGEFREPGATREYWESRVYEELTRVRTDGAAAWSWRGSAIREGIRVFADLGFRWRAEQERMRLGDALLCVGEPIRALLFIDASLASGELTTAAQVVARRLRAVAQWEVGEATSKTLDRLGSLRNDLLVLGFAHQARTVEADIARLLRSREGKAKSMSGMRRGFGRLSSRKSTEKA
jgi:hypothetical protein